MGKTLADGYLELRLDPSKLDADTKKAFKAIGFKQKGQAAGKEAGDGIAGSLREKLHGGLGAALGAIGIGAGIGAAITSGFKQALDVQSANDKLRAQLNLNKDQSARLGKAAGQLFAKGYGDSMDDVNDAIKSVVSNIPSLRNAGVPVLKDIAAGALNISRVFGGDVDETMAAVSSMLKSGIAPNAQAALDVLTKGLQSGADKGHDLLDTFTEYPVQFKKLGLDGATSLGLINQLLAHGARNSDVAADAIKEFSIRAIDGSKSTVKGYQLLGLNADLTAAKIAKGGPTARAAFGEVVARLNSMQDPLKRNAAGVDLFGTKWEDLGSAFRGLDVSKATSSLGQVAGATKTLATQSDSSRITTFLRTLQVGFVGVIGGQILPAITKFASANHDQLVSSFAGISSFARGTLLPVLKDFAGLLTGTIIPAVSSVVGWMSRHDTAVRDAAIAAGVLFGVYKVGTAVIAVQAANGILKYLQATKLVTAATKIWAGIQAVLNVVLEANPIGLIIVGLAALTAGVILAYKHSATFRAIVQGAWQGIQAAVSYAWTKVIQPAVQAIVHFFTDVLAPAATWLWKNVIKPAFDGIGWAVHAAWVVAEIAFKAWQLYLTKVLFPVIRFLYDSVVKPVFSAIGTTISWLWNNVAKPQFALLKAAFGALGSGLSAVWNNIIKPVFGALGGFITGTVVPGFKKGVDLIKTEWNKVKEYARKPVAFVVNKVINPFIGGINAAASIVGVKDKIATIPGFNDGFAAGGLIPGYATGGRIAGAPSSVDNRLAPATIPGVGAVKLAGGEFVVNARDTLKALPLLRWVNDGMRGGPRKVASYLGRPLADMPGDGSEGWAFKDGGLVGWVSNVWDSLAHPGDTIKKPFEALLKQIPGSGMIKDFLGGAAHKLLDGAISWLTNFATPVGGVGGPANVIAAKAFLQGANGKPYGWANAGPSSWDCSGIVSSVWDILHGKNPYTHTFSTESAGQYFKPGLTGPLLAGWSHPGQAPAGASVGHMMGEVGGLTFESTGSRGVHLGGTTRRITDFANTGHAFSRGGRVPVFDAGGTLMPGFNTVYNGLGRPEPLRRADQGGDIHFHFHNSVISSKQQAKDLVLTAYNDLKRDKKL